MKNRILFLLVFFNTIVFGQVPNTTTFSLQDVVNEVGPDYSTLSSCFADAYTEYFDPTYSGSKNNLLNFRNYGAHNACPKFVSSGAMAYQSSTNSLSITYPAAGAGDFVFIVACHYSSSTMSISGWTEFNTVTYNSHRISLFYKHFTSSDAGGTVNITSSDYVHKFASAHKVDAKSTSTLTQKNAFLLYPTNSYTPTETMTGDNCEMALAFSSLFISQSFSLTPASGWTTRQNTWQSSYGAIAMLSYNFTSTVTASNNTYGFTGPVHMGYISLLIE